MKKYILLVLLSFCLVSNDMFARGGRGGGGGGARMGGGGGGARMGGGMPSGGARPSMGGGGFSGRTPSMSMPSRPSFPSGGNFGGGNFSGARPGGGNFPTNINRPQGNRPSLGTLPIPGTRPGAGRPSTGDLPSLAGGAGTGSRPSAGSRPGFNGRPTGSQLDSFLDIGAGSRPSMGGRPGEVSGGRIPGGAANVFLKDLPSAFPPDAGLAGRSRPSTLPATRPALGGGAQQNRLNDVGRPGRPGDGNWANHLPNHRPDWNQYNDWRHDHWANINNNWNNHWHNNWHGCNHWFDGKWWNNHPGWRWHYGNGFNCWGWATWGAMTTWWPTWGWSEPIYYNYGNNVYYQDDMVYYGDQPVATSDEYAHQAEQIATSIPADAEPAPEDWMPLGVFSLTAGSESSSTEDPTLFLQLAVSKEGIISGSLQNTTANTVKQMEGMVDKQSQRAAWTVAGETRPIMETGIGNLTQDTAPALVHFADGTTQQWLLVRLDKPKETTGPAGAAPAKPPQ
jgi:hypothetical protein